MHARTSDDLSDAEDLQRQTDAFWWMSYCRDNYHRLPSELDPLIGMREYTDIQAHALVERAYAVELEQHRRLNSTK